MSKPVIRSEDHVRTGRLAVFKSGDCWYVCKGSLTLRHFPTHAEAIHYAQREALKAVAAHFTFPPPPGTKCKCEYTPLENHPGTMRKTYDDQLCQQNHPPIIRDEHPMEVPC